MSLETKVWLYGTRTDKTKSKEKKLIQIPSTALSRAKAFHVFLKKSPRSKWRRVTTVPIEIPSFIRSNLDKELFIDSVAESIKIEYLPVSKVPPTKPPTPPLLPILPKEKEVELPELPTEPRLTLTKKQFEAQMARILYDELDLQNLKWSESRIDSFIRKLWRAYSHAPHLIASESFRRSLVTQEIKRIRDMRAKKKRGKLEEAYRKELEKKEVSLDTEDVAGEVKVQFKEVFNTQYLPKPLSPQEQEELTPEQQKERTNRELKIKSLEDGLVVEKERQAAFAQVIVDYDKSIIVGKESLFASDEISAIAFGKVRKDMEKLFSQAIKKGLFKETTEPEYSFRVLIPLVDGNGDIPKTAESRPGKKRSGHGFSTTRVSIRNRRDLRKALDELFESMVPALTRYIKLNNSVGFMISGFSIERLIK